jgi:tripartite-type tricarboxylate transporter receptor subunit TctC
MRYSINRARAVVAIACWAASPVPGHAQKSPAYPTKPIRIVTGPAASQNDMVARTLGAKLSESFGQPVVIDNRAGAGGAIAANTVAKATPDGYTLLVQSAQFAIRAAVQSNLPYDPIKDFAGVAQIGFSAQAVVVSPGLRVKSIKEFIALAKAGNSPVFYGTGGAGTGMHMDAERFRHAAGFKATHVGFKGASEALIEVVAGRVHYAVAGVGPALPLIKDGKLAALAVVASQRSPLLPEVPAITDTLPGYERDASFGLFAPAGTPRLILQQLSKEVRRIVELPDVKDRLRTIGFIPAPSTPEEHDKILRADIEAYTKIAKLVGLRTY